MLCSVRRLTVALPAFMQIAYVLQRLGLRDQAAAAYTDLIKAKCVGVLLSTVVFARLL
jgi:hypothetical protein